MPTYEYFCPVVKEEFEEFHSIMIVLDDCPLCKEAGREPHAPQRLISGGAGKGIVELSMAEIKASMPGEVAKINQRARTDQNYLANLVGENRFNKQNPRG